MRKIRELVEAYENKFEGKTPAGTLAAHEEVSKAIREMIKEKKLAPEKVDFRGLWEQLVVMRDLEENIVSSGFPNIAGEIISSAIIQGYESFPKAGDKLARTVPSKLKVSLIPGWKAIGKIREVHEREKYGQVQPPDEKTVTIKNRKYGGLMDLTKEDIFFDQTGQLIDRARGVGEEAARFKEEIILNASIDKDSNAYSGGALYSGGNGNLLTSTPLGTDGWEDVDTELTAKTDDATGKPIWVFGDKPVMMVAAGLKHTALKLLHNERGDLGTGNLDVNLAKDQFDVVVNPYMTKTSTDWFYGSFKRQLRWEEVWPLETFMRTGQDTKDGFESDVIQQFKVSLYGGAGHDDFKYVMKCTA